MLPSGAQWDCLAVLQLYPQKAHKVQCMRASGMGWAIEPRTEDGHSPWDPPPHWVAQSNSLRGVALIMALTKETFPLFLMPVCTFKLKQCN